jgi:hypothetical protein
VKTKTTQRDTPTPRPRTTQADDPSASGRDDTPRFRSRRSDVHAGPKTAHTGESRKHPKRYTSAPRPRTTRADDTSTHARRDDTQNMKESGAAALISTSVLRPRTRLADDAAAK